MSRIIIMGAGAFGSALAVTLDRAGRDVTLVGRGAADIAQTRIAPRLPGVDLPASITVTSDLSVRGDDILLLALPMQTLRGFLGEHQPHPKAAVACCKGIDLNTGKGPTAIIADTIGVPSAILTGPSFAVDIARGLPTALTLATADAVLGPDLQVALSTDTMRLYLSDDPVGAELGGALKNVIAIACGITIGAGLGESARAALMTRGYAEIQRLALAMGAKPETLAGLAGFGDLTLTCTSTQSRNFSYGMALGQNQAPAENTTVEGRATAKAVTQLAKAHEIDMPIAKSVVDMIEGNKTLEGVLSNLLSRPLKKE